MGKGRKYKNERNHRGVKRGRYGYNGRERKATV